MINILTYLKFILFYSMVGYFTSMMQKLIIRATQHNSQVRVGIFILEIVIFFFSLLSTTTLQSKHSNSLISDVCSKVIHIPEEDIEDLNFVYGIISMTGSSVSFQA